MMDQTTPNTGAPAVAQTPAVAPAQAPAPAATAPVAAPTTVAQTQQVGKYTVQVMNDKCIGAASCIAISAAVFKLNEKNIAEVISQNDTDEAKLLAAQSCPTTAIQVTDTTTGEVVWPK